VEQILENEFYFLAKDSKKVYKKCKIEDSEAHIGKNRYKDINPMKLNMVTLDGKGYNGPNYFNGNYILGKDGNVDFIATQGPLKSTTEDFWNVVMLNCVPMIVGKSRLETWSNGNVRHL
jgi:protein tyrosine phosphatase